MSLTGGFQSALDSFLRGFELSPSEFYLALEKIAARVRKPPLGTRFHEWVGVLQHVHNLEEKIAKLELDLSMARAAWDHTRLRNSDLCDELAKVRGRTIGIAIDTLVKGEAIVIGSAAKHGPGKCVSVDSGLCEHGYGNCHPGSTCICLYCGKRAANDLPPRPSFESKIETLLRETANKYQEQMLEAICRPLFTPSPTEGRAANKAGVSRGWPGCADGCGAKTEAHCWTRSYWGCDYASLGYHCVLPAGHDGLHRANVPISGGDSR